MEMFDIAPAYVARRHGRDTLRDFQWVLDDSNGEDRNC
jgi:hypothetical protein